MKKILIIIGVLTLTSCYNYRKYKPTVMPSGKSKLTKKQIRRDFTN